MQPDRQNSLARINWIFIAYAALVAIAGIVLTALGNHANKDYTMFLLLPALPLLAAPILYIVNTVTLLKAHKQSVPISGKYMVSLLAIIGILLLGIGSIIHSHSKGRINASTLTPGQAVQRIQSCKVGQFYPDASTGTVILYNKGQGIGPHTTAQLDTLVAAAKAVENKCGTVLPGGTSNSYIIN